MLKQQHYTLSKVEKVEKYYRMLFNISCSIDKFHALLDVSQHDLQVCVCVCVARASIKTVY